MEISLGKLKHLGLALGIAGIIALSFLLPEEKEALANQISGQRLGERVVVSGTINGLEIRNGNAFFSIENAGKISAAFFKPTKADLDALRENGIVRAFGTISVYNERPEIIVDRVSQVD